MIVEKFDNIFKKYVEKLSLDYRTLLRDRTELKFVRQKGKRIDEK